MIMYKFIILNFAAENDLITLNQYFQHVFLRISVIDQFNEEKLGKTLINRKLLASIKKFYWCPHTLID